MKTDKSGGNAFPSENDHQSGNNTWHSSGMTLRQYYAAKAMQGLCSNLNFVVMLPDAISKAFAIADALINFEEQGK